MLSCNKEGTEVRKDFLVSKAISSEGGKSLFSFDFLVYKEMYLLLRRKDHFSIDTTFLLLLLLKDLNFLNNLG